MEEKKMFLAEMKDNQKEAFMTLAYALISADGILDEKEDLMMMRVLNTFEPQKTP